MSASEKFPFSVEVKAGPYGYTSTDAEITVLDGHDEVRGTGRGSLQLDLPAGLYAIQVERAGARDEEVRRHSGPTKVELREPKRFSAVPSSDTASSHEYYEAPAVEWSGKPTAPPFWADPGPMGSLFLFLRAPSAEALSRPLEGIGLGIFDYAGRDVGVLDSATTTRDPTAGWLAYHAEAPAGEYVLRYQPPDEDSPPPREMALSVFAGWQTQLFMTLANGPAFASASVLMGHEFRPDDRIAQAVDAALAGLQNGTDLLPDEERRLLLYGKFDNPMLGLVGAHVLFRASHVERSTIDTVLGNLEWLLGADSPDLRALRVMAVRRFGAAADPRPFERPPMLRAGLEAVLEAAVDTPELVPRGGVVAQIAVQRFVDSPWSTWKPLAASDTAGPESNQPVTAPDWVSGYVQDAALEAARRDQELDLATLAARASLPLDSVAEAYERVRASTEAGPTRTIAMERLVTRARREAKGLHLQPEAVRRTFLEGGEGDRIRALALMQGDPSSRDFDVALAGIAGSKSAFEQYHALRLAQQMVPDLDDDQRRELADAIVAQRRPGAHIKPGTDRWYLSRQVLADLGVGEHRGARG